MRAIIALALLLFALASPARAVDYRLDVTGGPRTAVWVTMRFQGSATGETLLDLPDRWSGSSDLWRNLGAWRASGARLLPSDAPAKLRLRHRPGAWIVLRYRVSDPDPALPGPDYARAVPVIERDWLYLHGEGVLVVPTGREDEPSRFRWGRVPRGWRAVSNLDRLGAFAANDAASSIFFAGRDLRLVERGVDGVPLRFAVLGQWRFTDAELADWTARLVTTENAMLGAAATPFTVTLAPLDNPDGRRVSYGGTGRPGGFALAGTANLPADGLPRLLGHEYAHRWFISTAGDDGPALYWLTEGFNDWFTALAMRRAGLWDQAAWARDLDARLRRHAGSSAHDLSPEQRFARFWEDKAAQQFPYDEGFLAAMMIDARLRAAGKGDLLAMLTPAARAGGIGDRAAIEARIEAMLPGLVAETAARLRGKGLPALPADALPCGRITRAGDVPRFVADPAPCPALAPATLAPPPPAP